MPKTNRTVGNDHTKDSHWWADYFISHPFTNIPSIKAKTSPLPKISFVLSSLPLAHNKTLSLKGIFPLHLISQKSTSIAYHLILNRSVASAHPACGDLVSARCTVCIAIHSPHMSSPKILCCRQLCHRVGSLAEFQEHVVGDPALRFMLSTAGG